VKVSAVENYNHWEQLYAANPDAVALVGLCAPDIASLGKLDAANSDKFVAGGYDLTAPNLQAVKDGHAYVTLGQSAFVQGYLPVALLVHAIKAKKPLEVGFYNAGTQVVTANSVDMANNLPALTFPKLQAISADPTATAAFYEPWTKCVNGPDAGKTCATIEPIAAEGQ
jgi:ABC-type sugar transport system substrate-binding protein